MKTIIQRITTLLLAVMSYLGVYAYDIAVNGIYYDIVSLPDLTCKVVHRPIIADYTGDIIIPNEITYDKETLKVIGIDRTAFRNSRITSISLPDAITEIPDRAFENCTLLTSVSLPDALTEIGDETFGNCTSLTSISLPNTVTKIGERAFVDCTSLTSISLPEALTEIGKVAFGNCRSLNSIILPDAVARIGNETFVYCTSLTSISLPDALTEIGYRAFRECWSLTSIVLPKNLTYLGSELFLECLSLTSVALPEALTEIGQYAFNGCTSLTSIELPNTVTKIGERAFVDCTSLTSVVLSDALTEIGKYAFKNCSSLTSVALPDALTEIGEYAFSGCSSLTSVALPDALTEIGEYAFNGCSSLTSVALPENLTEIPEGLFCDCLNLPKLTIPGKVLGLELGALNFYSDTMEFTTFKNCSNLKYLKFEHNNDNEFLVPYRSMGRDRIENWLGWEPQLDILYVDRLFEELFIGTCSQLEIGPNITDVRVNTSGTTSVVSYNLNPPSIPEFTMSQYMDIPVKVPYEALEAYKQAEIWKNFWNIEGFDAAGINNPEINSTKTVIGMYDLNGRYITEDYRGIGIIRYSDGSVKKVIL